MKCKVTRDLDACPWWESPLIVEKNGRRVVAAGTEIDQHVHPDTNVLFLIRNGEAVPADDEARNGCKMTPAQILAAQEARERQGKLDTYEEDSDDSDSD